jgi:sigma-E factor negative regulatory protein RseB
MHLLLIIVILLSSMHSLSASELALQSPATIPSSSISDPSAASTTDRDSSSVSEIDSKKGSTSDQIIIDSLTSLFRVISTANKVVNYHSLMTYEANGFITTYRLLHKVKDNVAEEQLIFMDGPRRQVIRKQKLNACLSGDTRWGLWPTVLSESLLSAYTLSVKRVERIADRESIVFEILPKDTLRFAYEYSIDKETGLLLRIVTYYKKVIVERLQTVAIEFASPESQLEFTGASDYLWRVPEAEPCYTEQFEPAWKADWLPEGFISVGNRITAQGEQVLIFADGLVSISVFIITRNPKSLQRATARHGATVVVITPESSKSNKSIAVVGEIPTATAIRIADFVKPI